MPRRKTPDSEEKKPTKKTTTKSLNTRTASPKRTKKTEVTEESITNPSSNRFGNLKINRKRALIVLAIILLLALAYANKQLFIAALVNNQPISNLELNDTLKKIYGDQVLDQMIDKKILERELSRNGIVVTQQQVNDRVTEIETQSGGKEQLDTLLASERMTRGQFTWQVNIRLLLDEYEKLHRNEATPSAQDIDKFIEENSQEPEATEPAKFRQTAIDYLTNQKLEQLLSEKFQQLKQNSNIQKF